MVPIPLILGGLSAVGGILSNRANAKQARDNRAFQERMSSTAAQRSVADFRAAGLNPALAYGQTASSPSGSTASQSDVATPAIASARDASVAKQSMELARQEQSNRNKLSAVKYALDDATRDKTAQEATTAEMNKRMAIRENFLQESMVPQSLQKRLAEALMADYQRDSARSEAALKAFAIPGARNAANLQSKLGTWGAGIPFLSSSAGGAAKFMSGLGILRR